MFPRRTGQIMTKKLKVQAEFDEEDIEDVVQKIEELKDLIDELKELRELQDERLQRNHKPITRTATPKKG